MGDDIKFNVSLYNNRLFGSEPNLDAYDAQFESKLIPDDAKQQINKLICHLSIGALHNIEVCQSSRMHTLVCEYKLASGATLKVRMNALQLVVLRTIEAAPDGRIR